jgi:hypothetical protein
VTGVHDDGDLADGASTAWRISEVPSNPAQGRLLNVIAVGDGGAPSLNQVSAIQSQNPVAGAVLSDVVTVFSAQAHGAPAPLPFSYTVAGGETRLHVIANLGQSVDVSASAQGNQKVITVTAGSGHAPSTAGVVKVEL